MTSLAAGIVDPTKAGKYPVVLSDALLGKDSKEILTGVRYNHKPSLSSPTAPSQARIKQTSSSSKKSAPSYDLSFQDDGGRYQYKGTRGVEDSKYVLIFDAAREVFVLHKVDSMFNMNLVQTPSSDAESLRREFPQLEGHSSSSSAKATGPTNGSKKSTKASNEEKKTTSKPRKQPPKAKKAEEKPALAMPEKKPPPKPIAATKPSKASADEEEESSDDDLGLTIENPGGQARDTRQNFSPGNIFGIRSFNDFEREEEGENDDADGEDDDDDNMEHFTLPSPINRQMQETSSFRQKPQFNGDEEEEEDEEMEDVGQQSIDADETALDDEMDLEAALMAELGEVDNAQESDVSEEE
ncbi:RNA polymerase II transcription elongation factor-domain-containing protein [Annulohypoxylon maeteangense]|uniref:RNA polymerase II transcription elongation factor-domain-containing protein n=1 Tax=Annulohypoxylon maeteangense TaxID=1927788 RepID=UPI002007EC12|nr:RNA polymerase II transcription elongation factor-domain-containing protein [Annulohypoxylon maeteangense]KAI0885985.1 RNA polymerase II transcription elongation factor-domain-containing protein [Annulohypoxylon maeteangense]